MSQAEFNIQIAPDGKVSIEVVGAQGPTCTELSAFLEQALGKVEKRDFKPEYYSAQTQNYGNIQHKRY